MALRAMAQSQATSEERYLAHAVSSSPMEDVRTSQSPRFGALVGSSGMPTVGLAAADPPHSATDPEVCKGLTTQSRDTSDFAPLEGLSEQTDDAGVHGYPPLATALCKAREQMGEQRLD